MINQHNPYNHQPQMGQPMMPPQFMPPQQQMKSKWQQRLLGNGIGRPLTLQQDRTLPNWLVGKSVLFFFIAFALCTVVWGYPMEMRYAIISSLSVLLFFFGSYWGCKNWAQSSKKSFVRNVFIIGLFIRLLWVFYCYFIFNPEYYGNTYGDGSDVDWYMPFGEGIKEWLMEPNEQSFGELMNDWCAAIDDVGYPIWLAVLYILSFGESDVFVPFLIKSIMGAYCAICIYKVASRHFGEGAARLAALFVALNPNMIYWCATMMKEAEMVFLCCLCVELVDRTFTGQKLTFRGLLPGVMVGVYLFFYRAPLAIVLFLAMFAHIVMTSNRMMSTGKKIIAGVMVTLVIFVGIGDRLRSQFSGIVEAVQKTESRQQHNAEWRAKREGGNSFAKYAGAAVFAPLIFTIPFPTFNVANEGQIVQQQLSGGSYIKNVFSFFAIFVIVIMILTGEWRRNVFILAYTLGYLACLVLSNFAQSGRFHMPIWPMLMLFAAYGIQVAKTNARMRRLLPLVFVLEVIVCLAWNWFKLKGRGMI